MNLNLLFKIWSKGEDNWNGEPRCEKQRLEEPAGSGEPLHTIFDEYADDQSAWMRDYVPAMEKMLANGYDSLVDAPDFTTGVKRLNLPSSHIHYSGCLPVPLWKGLGDSLVLLQERGTRLWPCLCHQI